MSETISRRNFMVGCCSAIAALAGSKISNLSFTNLNAAAASSDNEIVVVVFLRGGWDALNVVMPIAGADRGYYELARKYIQVPVSGANAAINLNGQFGMHPAMAPLTGLYQSKKLAFIHAAGLTYDTRSHFDAQEFIELGTPGIKTTSSGWLTRFLSNTSLPPTVLIPALSAGGSQAMSLLGRTDAVSMSSPTGFTLNGNWQYESLQAAALRDLYNGSSWLDAAGTDTLNTVDTISTANPGTYAPANGAVYPNDSFGANLQAVAQLIKMGVGLRAATIDVGGWDTHEHEGDGGAGYFADNQLKPLAQGMAAFYADLNGSGCGSNYIARTTLVVMSEFGRRLRENDNRGTDHGHGSLMIAMGGSVKGGQIYGQWPGLANDQLYDGADLAVTTDYRRVVGEILNRRLGIADVSTIFPGYTTYAPLDFMLDNSPHGVVIPPGLIPRIFLPSVSSGGAACP